MILEKGIKRKDMLGCVLCANPKCSKGCSGNIDPGRLLFDIWFDNAEYAASRLPDGNPCANCTAECEKTCIKSGDVPIKSLISRLYDVKALQKESTAVDYSCLETDICGVKLENPFVLSSSVVASTYDMCARAFEAGWAGVCFKTISTLEIHECSPRFSVLEGDNGEFNGFKNIEQLSDHSVAENMEIFRHLKEKYPTKVIIA